MSRSVYAIVYAYGRNIVNNGNRADYIHRFTTKAERTKFLDEIERAGNQDADEIAATEPRTRKAIRSVEILDEWPIAV